MKRLTATLALFVLGGCVIGTGSIYHQDDPYRFFSYAASHGGVAVMVAGEPYPERRREVAFAAITALERNFPTQGKAFRAVPPVPGDNTSKVVFLFNAASASAQAVCRDPSAFGGGASAGAKLTIGAVYCGVGPYSESWVSLDRPSGPDSPELSAALRDIIFVAIPRQRNPTRELDSCPPCR